MTLCGCLVHAKRKFHEALIASPDNEIAKKGENYILKLFAVEDFADKEQSRINPELYLMNFMKSS
ncbi:IS66 family transposase [Acetivibrio ethanolgignens]|uniref:IS66 family transposase n=1 Tax=Acetivibrio ethanolgignens TaxID=290052 RepID=UPI003BFA73A4